MKRNNPEKFSRSINYSFRNPGLLTRALTHSSYTYEQGLSYSENNERLEFLGDAFFDAVVAEELYLYLSENHEGDLSRVRAAVVCEDSLFRKAEALHIRDYLMAGKGEMKQIHEGTARSLEADALEAVFGAVYLDGGYDAVRQVIRELFQDEIQAVLSGRVPNRDSKSELQERVQASGTNGIKYEIISESGPDHNKTFDAEVRCNGRVMGRGSGRSKKEAEQNAARDALHWLNRNEDQ